MGGEAGAIKLMPPGDLVGPPGGLLLERAHGLTF